MSRPPSITRPAAALLTLLCVACGSSAAPKPTPTKVSFSPLTPPSDAAGNCYVHGVSDDGRVVIGECINAADESQVVVWTDGVASWKPMTAFCVTSGDLTAHAFGTAISGDGKTIGANCGVGDLMPLSYYALDGGDWQQIASTGEIEAWTILAIGSDADGIQLAGSAKEGGYRYTESTGGAYVLPSLGTIFDDECASGDCTSHVLGMDASATYLVGFDDFTMGGVAQHLPIRYRMKGGQPPIVLPALGFRWGEARMISRDGTAIAGMLYGPQMPAVPVVWNEKLEPTLIETLELDVGQEYQTAAYATANGGARVVGMSAGHAFVWEPTKGTQALADVLAQAGVKLDGWDLWVAINITPDGKILVGNGFDSTANFARPFIVHME